jgi:uncharacterized protein
VDAANPPGVTTARPVELETTDGVTLHGDLALPPGARAGAIVCHPHPQYGGTRFDGVVTALFDTLPGAGIAALRFDFRRRYGGGIDEVLDARAALAELSSAVPTVPLVAVGYSFGAMVVLALDDPVVTAKVLVAPPLGSGPTPESSAPSTAVLVLTPEHDQFCPPEAARAAAASWPAADLEILEGTDHFLTGRRQVAADRAAAWIGANLG